MVPVPCVLNTPVPELVTHQDTVGLEGEITIPLIRGSHLTSDGQDSSDFVKRCQIYIIIYIYICNCGITLEIQQPKSFTMEWNVDAMHHGLDCKSDLKGFSMFQPLSAWLLLRLPSIRRSLLVDLKMSIFFPCKIVGRVFDVDRLESPHTSGAFCKEQKSSPRLIYVTHFMNK